MKLVLNILEIFYQLTASAIVSISDRDRDNFYITNSKESESFTIINRD